MTIQQSGQKAEFLAFMDRKLSFADLCRMAWLSADDMCGALQDVGLNVSVSSCKAYRNSSSEPRKTLGDAIEAIAEHTIDQTTRRRRERLDAHRMRRQRLG